MRFVVFGVLVGSCWKWQREREREGERGREVNTIGMYISNRAHRTSHGTHHGVRVEPPRRHATISHGYSIGDRRQIEPWLKSASLRYTNHRTLSSPPLFSASLSFCSTTSIVFSLPLSSSSFHSALHRLYHKYPPRSTRALCFSHYTHLDSVDLRESLNKTLFQYDTWQFLYAIKKNYLLFFQIIWVVYC